MFEIWPLVLKFLLKAIASFFNIFFIDVEGEQINFDRVLNSFINDICHFKLPHPRMS